MLQNTDLIKRSPEYSQCSALHQHQSTQDILQIEHLVYTVEF